MGPPADTQAFHQATPAPGERTLHDGKAPPPPPRDATTSGSNLPKIPVRQRVHEERHEPVGQDLTLPVVAVGAVVMAVALLAGALAVGMLWFGGEEKTNDTPPAPEHVEGIPVRKDLKSR